MLTNLKRVLFAALSAAMFLAPAMVPAASAATGPWSWNDISDKITVRQNRPVWAMAYASPYWYLTDGQDLWNGGHVWKTEGSNMTDITVEVRNAGMSRVDDILSDGSMILFLKNVVARNNSFEVMAYNGSYDNRTSYLRQYFGSDEGIASMTGKDNKWIIVTTKGRVIQWNKSTASMTTFISNTSSYQSSILYSVRHASPADGYLYLPVAAVPVSNGWLVATRDQNTVRFWRYDSYGSATEVTSNFGTITYLHALTSNGTTAILAGGDTSTTYANRIYTYDGVNTNNLSTTAGSLPFSSWNRVIMSWNGSSWMILSNKDLVRFDGSSFQSYGKTRDYFVTIAANPTKTFVLGGAVSNDGISDGPSSPLTAKMVKVTEDGGISENNNSSTNQNQTTVNGISSWPWFEPNQTTLNRYGTVTFNVGAWSNNGLKRIEIWVNGQNRRTCDFGLVNGSQNCSYQLYGYDYPLNTSVAVNAKIIDGKDKAAWTDLKYLTVSDTSNTNQTTNGDISTWNWLEPSNSSLARGNSATLKVQANASQGLNRVEVYVNGNVRRTCDFSRVYGTQTCDLTIYGSDYSAGSQLTMNAKATDYNGKTVWSDMRYLNITDSSSGSNQNTNNDISITAWLDPNSTTLNRGTSLTYHVQANASQGLNRIEVYVNGTTKRYCDLVRAYGTQTCDITINGNDYSAGSQLTMNAKAMDYNGKTVWSELKYITINEQTQNNQSNTNSNPTSSWVWSDPETSELKTNASVTYNVGSWDGDGLQKTEIWVNGSVMKTCYGTRDCSLTLNGSAFTAGTDIFVNAKIFDINNNVTWSASRSYHVTAASSGTGTSNTATQTWLWSIPEVSTLHAHESATWYVGAWDADALQRIEIWVNGQVKNTCQLGNAYERRECSYTIRANDYPAGTSVFVNGSVLDGLGNVAWSNSKTYAIQSSAQTSGQDFPVDLPGNIQVSSNADNGYTNNQLVTFTATANDQDGIDRIDLMVNATLVKSCYNQNTCSYTGGPYNDRTTVSYGAKIVDKKGFAIWTGYRTINKK